MYLERYRWEIDCLIKSWVLAQNEAFLTALLAAFRDSFDLEIYYSARR